MQVTLEQLPEADIAYDPALHRWTVSLLGETRSLSEWRWAPRKRLVAAAADAGRLDAARFARGFASICWSPEPPDDQAELWAWIGLSLVGIGPLVPAADAEAALAMQLGLTPALLADERVSDLDSLLAAAQPPAASSDSGWNVLRFEDDVP
jgi:hypothetical protein